MAHIPPHRRLGLYVLRIQMILAICVPWISHDTQVTRTNYAKVI